MFSLQALQCTVGTDRMMVTSGSCSSVGGQEVVDDRKRRRRRLLVTTNRLEPAMARPASIGLSSPAAASGIAATL